MSLTFWKMEADEKEKVKQQKRIVKFNDLDKAKLDLIRLQCRLLKEEDATKIDKKSIADLNRVIAGKKEQIIEMIG